MNSNNCEDNVNGNITQLNAVSVAENMLLDLCVLATLNDFI